MSGRRGKLFGKRQFKRNPVARALRSPHLKPKVVEDKREKLREKAEEDDD